MSLRTGLFWFWGAILVGGAAGAAGLQMMGAPDPASAQPASDPKEATAAGMDLQFSPAPVPTAEAAQTQSPAAPSLPPLPPLAKAPPVSPPVESHPAPRESASRAPTSHALAHRSTHASTHSSRRSVAATKRTTHRSVTVARKGTTTTTTTVTEQPVYGTPPRSYVYAPYPRRWAPYAQAYYPAYPYYPYYAPYGVGD